MTTNEMKGYLANYRRLKSRAERLVREMESFPKDRAFLEPLLQNVTETAEDIACKIAAVEREDRRELLVRKYMHGETLEGIGERLGYSARHVQRLINRAVASMKEVAD